MMIEFEDREPAPRMSWGEKLFLWSIVAVQVFSLYSCGSGVVALAT